MDDIAWSQLNKSLDNYLTAGHTDYNTFFEDNSLLAKSCSVHCPVSSKRTTAYDSDRETLLPYMPSLPKLVNSLSDDVKALQQITPELMHIVSTKGVEEGLKLAFYQGITFEKNQESKI